MASSSATTLLWPACTYGAERTGMLQGEYRVRIGNRARSAGSAGRPRSGFEPLGRHVRISEAARPRPRGGSYREGRESRPRPASAGRIAVRRPISGPLTPVTSGLSRSLADTQLRRSGHATGPDGTDSQADSAGSIPVTRSKQSRRSSGSCGARAIPGEGHQLLSRPLASGDTGRAHRSRLLQSHADPL